MPRLDLWRCSTAAALLLACGTDSERDPATGTSPTSMTSPTSITSATTPGTASEPEPTAGTGDTVDPETTGMSGLTGMTATTTGVTGPGETGVGTTDFDPPPTGEYAANYIAGEQNHLSVRKADLEQDWCATITFVAPQDMGPLEYDVALPTTWRVKSALIHQGAADCLAFTGFPGEPTMAISGTGTASWASACPATLTIDINLAFPPEQPWIPPEVLLQSPAVAVGGC
jgi:hypothetical protein